MRLEALPWVCRRQLVSLIKVGEHVLRAVEHRRQVAAGDLLVRLSLARLPLRRPEPCLIGRPRAADAGNLLDSAGQDPQLRHATRHAGPADQLHASYRCHRERHAIEQPLAGRPATRIRRSAGMHPCSRERSPEPCAQVRIDHGRRRRRRAAVTADPLRIDRKRGLRRHRRPRPPDQPQHRLRSIDHLLVSCTWPSSVTAATLERLR